MRDRRARVLMVGLILALPALMALAARGAAARPSALTVIGVEAVLTAGLLTAARERRLLTAERAALAARAPAPRQVPSLPHVRAARPAPAAVRASTR